MVHPTSEACSYLSHELFLAIASAADFVDEDTRDIEEQAMDYGKLAGEIPRSHLAEWWHFCYTRHWFVTLFSAVGACHL